MQTTDYDEAMSWGLPRSPVEADHMRALRVVARREAELRDMIEHLDPFALARVDLDSPQAVETFLAQRCDEWRHELGLAS